MFKNVIVMVVGVMVALSGATAWAQEPVTASRAAFGYDSEGMAKAVAMAEAEGFLPPMAAQPKRPAILPALYVSLGAMQVLDLVTTNQALKSGAHEGNPMVSGIAGNSGAMIAYKTAMTVGTVIAVEKMWKRNRVGAIVVAVAANGVTAAVAAHNVKVAGAQRAR